jgi:hypothetical protein
MNSIRLVLLAAALAVGAGSSFAQAKREDVKAEAAAANKAGATKTPEGTSGPAAKADKDMARPAAKADAAAANKAGATKTAEGETGPAAKPAKDKARAEVKAEAKAANKAGATKTPEGEAGKK